MNILEKIANELDTFSKSERKVAEVILSSPGTVIQGISYPLPVGHRRHW